MDWKELPVSEVGVTALIAGSIRYMLTSTRRSPKEIAIAIAIAWAVAEATHPIIVDFFVKWGLEESSAIGATGAVAFLAPDLLHGLLNLGKVIREEGFISVIKKLRG